MKNSRELEVSGVLARQKQAPFYYHLSSHSPVIWPWGWPIRGCVLQQLYLVLGGEPGSDFRPQCQQESGLAQGGQAPIFQSKKDELELKSGESSTCTWNSLTSPTSTCGLRAPPISFAEWQTCPTDISWGLQGHWNATLWLKISFSDEKILFMKFYAPAVSFGLD